MNNISGVLLRLNVRVSTTYELPPVRSMEMQGTYSIRSIRCLDPVPVRSMEMQGTYSSRYLLMMARTPVRSIDM